MIFTDIIFIISSLLILAASAGTVRFGERKNIVYARLHIAGAFDVACILVLLAAGEYLIAITYLALTPIAIHAIANARYHEGEGK
ncbi:cation:proton antiporter [Candidatus Altiarchaeota archaeon]